MKEGGKEERKKALERGQKLTVDKKRKEWNKTNKRGRTFLILYRTGRHLEENEPKNTKLF